MAKYIVRLKDNTGFKQCSKTLLVQKKKFTKMKHLNMIALEAESPEEITSYLDPDQILQIVEDVEVQLIQDHDVDGDRSSWSMEKIGGIFTRIPKRYSRPKVAILDSGLSIHPALRLTKQYANFTSERSPIDLNGHGTHIAGIIGGRRTKSSRFHGIFPSLPLTSVKVFDRDGSAQLLSVIRGIEWCMDQGMQIVNMSFGITSHQPLLHETIRMATERGILFIAASGNNGKPYVSYPARYPEVLAVGSINENLEPSSFSQFGNSIDIVAPGENIHSTWIKKSYRTLSGTSMACAHVTGVAALILAVKPKWKASQIRQLLLSETQVLDASYLKQGAGMVSLKKIKNRLLE